MSGVRLIRGDCLEVLPTLEESSISLVVCDPPYHRIKMSEDWDRQWKTDAAYLEWIGRLCGELSRVLRPNGSLYLFASPRMAARVECKVGETFEVLNHVVWNKLSDYEPGDLRATAFRARDHESFRRYFDYSERIIFAEHFGADNVAKGEAGWVAKCDEVRGFVFEPIRAYLDGERKRAGVPHRVVISYLGMGGHDTHFFSPVQWKLPLPQQYEAMRTLFRSYGDGDYLRREYEDLRQQYEDLRRPFSVSADVPYTDVWDFPTVPARPGKHPCEKPYDLVAHIIRASSRPGDLVLDPCAGSGVTGLACRDLGRRAVLVERDERWCRRIEGRLAAPRPAPLPLFADVAP